MLGGLDYKGIGTRVKAWLSALANVPSAKGDLWTSDGTINQKLAIGADGKVLAADSTQSTGQVYIDNPARPNLLVSPNWQIDQINEGALYTVNTTDVRGPDGWSGDAVGTGVFKLRTLADPDNAALKCLEISCTTADAAIAAADRYEVWTAVEGYDAAAFMLGTSAAGQFVYQFKAKSNAVTGVFGVYFTNSAGNRFYAGTITIPDTSEHEYSVPITGDLAGTWLYTNGIGLRMGLVLSAGSNFQGAAGAWSASTVRTTSGQANFMSANTNILYLKRGSLHQGALVQAYKPADVQRELARAQRYYEKTFDQGVAVAQNVAGGGAGSYSMTQTVGAAAAQYGPSRSFAVVKRATPTMTSYNYNAANAQMVNNITGTDCSGTAFNMVGLSSYRIDTTTPAGSAAGQNLGCHVTANARLS